MRKAFLVGLSALSLALASCAKPTFVPIESGDGGLVDPPPNSVECEEDQSILVCSSGACDRICHRTDGPRLDTLSRCEIQMGADGTRYDYCKAENVCLKPGGDGTAGYYCFHLCGDAAGCLQGVACGVRPLSGSTSIRVCDPPYQPCTDSSGCCDPLQLTGCDPNQWCYLVPPPLAGSRDSWTVCDYSTGGLGHGDLCRSSRDCSLGLACVDGACAQVCDPTDPKSCGEGAPPCHPYQKQWGVCPG